MQNSSFNTIYTRLPLLLIALGCSLQMKAQKKEGEVKTDEIEVWKEAKVNLPQANRIFEKISTAKIDNTKKPIRYEFIERRLPVETPEFSPTVTMPDKGSTKENEFAERYNNIIRAGIGNYGHTFLEGHGGFSTGEDNYHGVYIKHNSFRLGPIGANYSGQSQNLIKVHSRTSFSAVKLAGALGWERRGFDYYAYNNQSNFNFPESQIFNSWNKFNFTGTVSNNNKNAKVDYVLNSNLSYLFTHLKANELVWNANLKGVYPLTEQLSALLEGSIVIAQRQDSLTLYRNLYKVKPTFQFKNDLFSITAGLNIINDREKNTFNNSYLFPIVKIDVQPIEGVKVFAGYEGDVYANNLSSLLTENQWLGRFTQLRNTRKTADYFAGAKTTLPNGLSVEAKISYARYKDFYVFNSNSTDSTRFDVMYSNDTTIVKVTTFSGQASYQIPDVWRSNFKFDVNVYSGLGNLENAWHRPAFNATWTNTFTVKDKLLLASDFYFITGLKGKNYVSNREVKLNSIIDLNLKATYLLSEHLDLFISVNNILNKSYQRYLYYPTQGVNFLGGLSYSF